MIVRKNTRLVRVQDVAIGGGRPPVIQAMAKNQAKDIARILPELKSLEFAGAEILRIAVKDRLDADSIKEIKRKFKAPLVGDIHFDYRLAIIAIKNGIDKIRLNPGNIYNRDQIKEVCSWLKKAGIPVRVGVNSGSVLRNNRDLTKKKKDGKNNALSAIMVKSALDYIKILESFGIKDIVVSLKAEDVLTTIDAYQRFSQACDYPLHVGITASGSLESGLVKTSIGLGVLLSEGIGDTIRVSLTASAVKEVEAAKMILQSLKLRSFAPEIISCPTCGRCRVDLEKIVLDVERKLSLLNNHKLKPLKVAIMGCEVNGPGEARSADIGIAFADKNALTFKKGKLLGKINQNGIFKFIVKELGDRE